MREIVGVSDEQPSRAAKVLEQVGLPPSLFVSDYRELLERTKPDLTILCPSTATHAQWTEKVAPYGCHVLVEKPFAASVADADRMDRSPQGNGKTAHHQLAAAMVCIAHYRQAIDRRRRDRRADSGSLLRWQSRPAAAPCRQGRGTRRSFEPRESQKLVVSPLSRRRKPARLPWLRHHARHVVHELGRVPVEVSSMVDHDAGLEVDQHSITIVRYDLPNSGLSKFETRWGTFTDPWTHQPQPKCGFVLAGRSGTIASYDYRRNDPHPTAPIAKKGFDVPVDTLSPPFDNPINYAVHKLRLGEPIDGPLSPVIARIGQQIVDAAMRSTTEKRTVTT